jgi:hypothetical protein
MSHTQKIVLGVFLTSLGASIAASLFDARLASYWLGAPAVVLSAWSAIGHLTTVDDDYPGGFSNSEKNAGIWHRSLWALALKVAILLVTVWLVVLAPSGQQTS